MANVAVDLEYEITANFLSLDVTTGSTERNIPRVDAPVGKKVVGCTAVIAPGGDRRARIELFPGVEAIEVEKTGTYVNGKLRWEPGEVTNDTTIDLFVYLICVKV